MASITYTPNLRLAINSELTSEAKANLRKLDALGSTWRINNSGDLYVESVGNIYLSANAGASDIVAIGDFVPFADDTYDIGAVAARWRDLHLSGDAEIGGDLTVLGTLTGASIGLTGSLVVNVDLTVGGDATIWGDIVVGGTVDGRDVAVDGATLDAHLASSSEHGITAPSEIVGTDEAQLLINKTISATTNTITDLTDLSIDAAADIARSKLAPGNAQHVLINDGAGVMTSEASLSPIRGGTGVSSTATFPLSGVIVTRDSVDTLSNKAMSGLANSFSNIGYASLDLTGSIVNGDIAAGAAIHGSKIMPNFGLQEVYTGHSVGIGNLGAFKISLRAPAGLAADYDFEFPNTAGLVGQFLTRGAGGSLAWSSVSTSTFMADGHVDIGTPTNVRAQVDTAALGDIAASTAGGLEIKPGVIVDADINATAAIDHSKMAALTASRALESNASGVVSPSAVTSAELGYVSGVTSSIQSQLDARERLHTYRLTVGANGRYATIAAANAAAALLPLGAAQRCLIEILPGIYPEDLIGQDYVDYCGSGFQNTLIAGKIDLCGVDSQAQKMGVLFTPAADGDIGFCLGTGFGLDVFVYVNANANFSFKGIEATGAAGPSGMINCAVFITDIGVTTKDYIGIDLDGAAFVAALNCAVEINSTASGSGTHTGLLLTNSGELAVSNTRVYASHDAGFTGECRLQSIIGAPTPCLVVGSFLKAVGAGGGICTAFYCDSSGAGAIAEINFPTVDVTGYATFRGAFTAAGDEQNIRNFAAAQVGTVEGAGITLATPYDEGKSGFVQWIGAGDYWSRTGNQFTVLRGGAGYTRSIPVVWLGGQTITLTADSANYIYADTAGVLQVTTTKSLALYRDNVVLFTVLYTTAGNTVVVKENHPYEFDTAVSDYAHHILGILIGTTGADIGVLGAAANREVNLTGDSVLSDHGLNTIIPNSSASALSIQYWYRDATDGFKWKLHSISTAVPLVWNNGSGVPIALGGAGNTHTAFRLYVTKDSLNSSAPQYIAVINENAYGNQGSTNTAIAAGSITSQSSYLMDLELAQLGYLKITSAGGGSLWGVQIEKSQIGTTLSVAGTTATTAGAVATDTSTFDGILSGADTSVQSALETIDNHATHKGSIAAAALTDVIRIGPDATAGSWRLSISSGDLLIEEYTGAAWVEKARIG